MKIGVSLVIAVLAVTMITSLAVTADDVQAGNRKRSYNSGSDSTGGNSIVIGNNGADGTDRTGQSATGTNGAPGSGADGADG